MGYYVTLTETNATIPADKLDEAYTLLCELNQHNELKRGGLGGRDETIVGPHKGIWFSWMDWNYPEVYSNAVDILRAVGYDIFVDGRGTAHFAGYDEKNGCQDVFAEALLPVLVSSDDNPLQFHWRGEDGEVWRNIAIDGAFVAQEGKIVFEDL
jgi:hypothetical protein